MRIKVDMLGLGKSSKHRRAEEGGAKTRRDFVVVVRPPDHRYKSVKRVCGRALGYESTSHQHHRGIWGSRRVDALTNSQTTQSSQNVSWGDVIYSPRGSICYWNELHFDTSALSLKIVK